MSPDEAFVQWSVYRRDGTSAASSSWSRLAEALGRLVLQNSRELHGRAVLARLNELDAIVSDLRVALCGNDEAGGPDHGDGARHEPRAAANPVWSHLKPEIAFLQGANSDHFRHVDRRLLEQVIERYMRHDWLANDLLDWMLADASVYDDVVSFGESIKRNVKGLNAALHVAETGGRARRFALRAAGVCGELSAFVVGPIAIAALAARHVTDRLVLWVPPAALACVIIYAIVAVLRVVRRNRQKKSIGKAMAQWSAMSAAYRSLADPRVSLARIGPELEAAAGKGVKWNGQIFALLAHARARGARAR